MQPLISPVDHESRHNSYRADEAQSATEDTPLLQRFPQPVPSDQSNRINTAIISLLLIILISGIVIGIYLLIIQINSENVLPPVENPLRLVTRTQWDSSVKSPTLLALPFMKAEHVIVVQTDSEECHSLSTCTELLRNLQANMKKNTLPHNFLVSSDGNIFEALGWRRSSPLFPQYGPALNIAFIGNFTDVPPSLAQLDCAKIFFDEAVRLRQLDSTYDIIGKTIKSNPKCLFQSLKKLPQWNNELSDS